MDLLYITDLFKSARPNKYIQVDISMRSTIGSEYIIDHFEKADYFFIRRDCKSHFSLLYDQSYFFEKLNSGGFLGKTTNSSHSVLWIPTPAIERRINLHNQIEFEQPATLFGFGSHHNSAALSFSPQKQNVVDLIIWRFPSNYPIEEITLLNTSEIQGYFLWGSHSTISKPADLYRHLIHGSVYDLRYSWPHHKKCFSENEAHALYTVYAGLENATGKSIYRFFQLQIVLSVIHRQAEDGGWYHGMWTDGSECHYRLHTSGVHLLMDEYARSGCPTVKSALEKAVAFLSNTADRLDCGVWFLHDSLELSEDAMNKGPFKWIASRTLGKSVSNMLVLNTHLDTTIALKRYSELTGDRQYDDLIASALNSTNEVLSLQPADWLYKPLFWAIGLTMLPTEIAKSLPLPIRAIKRFAANYLVGKLPDMKARFPRLVMPNGYIDRELSLRTWAVDYQTINLMDLARYARVFPGRFDESILDKALEFTYQRGLIKRYRELQPGKQYAPGFWMEALYHRCLAKQDLKYRRWLAEAILQCHSSGLGIAPSLLGCNGEAVPYKKQVRLTPINHSSIIVANLSHDRHVEVLLINTAEKKITLTELDEPFNQLNWSNSHSNPIAGDALLVDAMDWVIGKQD